MRFETLAVHAGQEPDPSTGAVTLPIHLSTTFERAADGTFPSGFNYTRDANPNRRALETCLARLENGTDAAAFSSGMAATAAIFQALEPGAHVLVPDDSYYVTRRLLREIFQRWGLQHSEADVTDSEAVARALRPETRLVWIETPSNPLLRVSDIAAVAAVARSSGARVACDNTWATPLLTRPLELGADLVVHSTTKYLGGHSDLLGGAVVARAGDDLFQRIRTVQVAAGAVPSPFDCWLLLRGIRSLAHRLRAHCAHARAVAGFLASHPAVARVHFPGLASHPGHAVAARQMADYGGMLSFEVRGARAEAMGVAARLTLITRATSLGGPETLIEHRASVEGPATKTPESLLRLSVGLEHPDDLIADLAQALEAA